VLAVEAGLAFILWSLFSGDLFIGFWGAGFWLFMPRIQDFGVFSAVCQSFLDKGKKKEKA